MMLGCSNQVTIQLCCYRPHRENCFISVVSLVLITRINRTSQSLTNFAKSFPSFCLLPVHRPICPDNEPAVLRDFRFLQCGIRISIRWWCSHQGWVLHFGRVSQKLRSLLLVLQVSYRQSLSTILSPDAILLWSFLFSLFLQGTLDKRKHKSFLRYADRGCWCPYNWNYLP